MNIVSLITPILDFFKTCTKLDMHRYAVCSEHGLDRYNYKESKIINCSYSLTYICVSLCP